MHSTDGEFPIAVAEVMLRRSGHARQASAWWYSGARLYQVAIQPFYSDPSKKTVSGVVIAGRGIGAQELNDLARISSTQVALRYGDDIVASTIAALKQAELADQLRDQEAPEQVQIDDERYWGSLKVLTPGLNPPVSLIVLKSDRQAMASLAQLNRMLLGLGLLAIFVAGALVFAICDTFTRPLGNLLGGVDALEKGDFEYRLGSRGNDEVAQSREHSAECDRPCRPTRGNGKGWKSTCDVLRRWRRSEGSRAAWRTISTTFSRSSRGTRA